MSVLGLAVGFLTLLCAGFGVTLLLLRGSAARNLLECACLSWLLGTGTVSLLLWSGGFFLSGVPLQCLVIAAALALALAGWRYRGKGKFTFPWPAQAAEWLLAGIIVLEIGAMVLLSLGQPLGWDGSFNWEIKARFAFLNHGVMPPGYYSNGSQTNSHPEYPLFIPFTQLWLDLWMGQAHQFWEKAVIPLFNAAGVLLLSLLGARLSGRRCIGGLASALLFFVPYLAHGVGGITSGYLDFPLGVLYLSAIGYLLLYEQSGNPTYFCLYAASLALLPWMKREGAILWLVGAVLGLGIILRRKAGWRPTLGLLPGLLISISWQLYLRARGGASPHDFVPASLATLAVNFSRIWPICRTVFRETYQTERWGVFWLLAAVAFVYQLLRRRDLRFLSLWMAIVAPLVLYSCTYLFSAWPNYVGHIHASLPRLLLQLTPLSWLAIALGLRLPRLKLSESERLSVETGPNEEKAMALPLAARRPASW